MARRKVTVKSIDEQINELTLEIAEKQEQLMKKKKNFMKL